MDNWERLLLYRKKLVLPRVYQLVDWFSWLACFFAILFIAFSTMHNLILLSFRR